MEHVRRPRVSGVAAGAQLERTIAQLARQAGVVRGHNNGSTLEELTEEPRALAIEAGVGLVQDEQLGPGQYRPAKCKPLLLPTRELRHTPATQRRQTDERQCLYGLRAAQAVQRGKELQVF